MSSTNMHFFPVGSQRRATHCAHAVLCTQQRMRAGRRCGRSASLGCAGRRCASAFERGGPFTSPTRIIESTTPAATRFFEKIASPNNGRNIETQRCTVEERATGRNAHMSGSKGPWRLVACTYRGLPACNLLAIFSARLAPASNRVDATLSHHSRIHHTGHEDATFNTPHTHNSRMSRCSEAQRSEYVPPASGDTMTTSSAEVFISSVLMYSSSSGVAYRLSIGNETKPCICAN